jgi:hypothetical protein
MNSANGCSLARSVFLESRQPPAPIKVDSYPSGELMKQ